MVIHIQFLFKNYMYVSMGTLIIYIAILFFFMISTFPAMRSWKSVIGKMLYKNAESIYYGIKA